MMGRTLKKTISKTNGDIVPASSHEIEELLTAKELESLLKIDQKTIYRYVACGLIPYVRIQSNIRFIKRQIVAWIDGQNHCPKTVQKSNGNQP
jgi:predicted DNA-binding transcriptional regulator AlpA